MSLVIENLEGLFDGYTYHKGPLTLDMQDGKISKISQEKADSNNTQVIDGRGLIASVPFHDAHTHAIFAGTRFFELSMKLEGKSYSEILAKGGGIKYTVSQTRGVSDEVLRNSLMERVSAMFGHGSGMVEVKTGYGLSTEEELRQLRIINQVDQESPVNVVATFGGAHVVAPDQTREAYVASILDEMIPVIAKEKLATTTDVFCDRGAFTVEETEEILQRSISLGLPIRVHAEELEYTGIGKIAAEKYNSLSVDHLLLSKFDDFEIYKKHDTVANFMPLAPISLFTDAKPSGWREAGATIGLGSDFNPNNWVASMQPAIRMAVFHYRMTPLEAFTAATSGSYQAITGNKMDKLSEGSPADLILLKASTLDEISMKFGQNLVRYVIKDGTILVENKHTIL